MKREKYQQIKQIYQSARDLPADKRSTFLAQACQGDMDLRREVEELLDSYDSDYLEQPAVGKFAETIVNSGMESGRILGHYKIEKKIGEGGMGVVFAAEDIRNFGRKVALKVLPAELSQDKIRLHRFEREARAASALNHPNIITFLDFGTENGISFIVTELVQGETLRNLLKGKPLSLQETLDIVLQIAAALEAAHAASIIHRDIKPENIMLRDDGVVKVLDFGLAKLIEKTDKFATSENKEQMTTATGEVPGTVAYMSPEQLSGEIIDVRSDIWSLGIVLNEMLTGKNPILVETVDNLNALKLKSDSSQLNQNISTELNLILRKVLRKNREERYQTIKDFRIDLKHLKHSMEVDEEIQLSYPPSFKTETPPKPVNYYRRNFIIGLLIAFSLLAMVGAFWFWQHRQTLYLQQQETLKGEVKKHYSDGRFFFGKRSKDGLQKAKEQFEQAIDKDPNFALAYVGLADFYVVAEEYFGTPSAETIPKAEEYIDKALELDRSLGEAYATRGFIRAKQWKWDEAGEFYVKSIESNRNYATGRQWYSWYLRNIRDYTASREQIEFAYKLAINDDSLLPIIHANVVIAYLLEDNLPRAIEEGNKLVARYPDFWQGYSWLGRAYQKQGNRTEALKNLRKAVDISKRSHTILANLGYCLADYGESTEAKEIIKELKDLYQNKKATGQSIAKVYNGLGDKDEAFKWLDEDLKARSGDLPNISWHPAFKSLHDDPRFKNILHEIGLSPVNSQ